MTKILIIWINKIKKVKDQYLEVNPDRKTPKNTQEVKVEIYRKILLKIKNKNLRKLDYKNQLKNKLLKITKNN